jgi:hypothetical protein
LGKSEEFQTVPKILKPDERGTRKPKPSSE